MATDLVAGVDGAMGGQTDELMNRKGINDELTTMRPWAGNTATIIRP
jgi:hypothetical protein